jgi:hypothetical protein
MVDKRRRTAGKEDHLKRLVHEAVREALMDSGALSKIIKEVAAVAISQQTDLLQEVVNAMEDNIDYLNESIDRKLENHVELIESKLEERQVPLHESYDGEDIDDIHRQYAYNARKAASEPLEENIGARPSIKSRRGNMAPSAQNTPMSTKQSRVANEVKKKLGVDVFADITASDLERVPIEHSSFEQQQYERVVESVSPENAYDDLPSEYLD